MLTGQEEFSDYECQIMSLALNELHREYCVGIFEPEEEPERFSVVIGTLLKRFERETGY